MHKRLALALTVAVAATAQTAEETAGETRQRYLRFACEGFADVHRMTNRQVRRMLAEGIASGDRRIVDLTVLALINLTILHDPDFRKLQARPWNSNRHIDKVPGLKRFLMAHWRAHAEGRDHEPPMTDIARPEWFRPSRMELLDPILDSGPKWKDWVWESRVRASVKWQTVPLVLATHWPRDPEVLALIWEVRDYHYARSYPDAESPRLAQLRDEMGFDTRWSYGTPDAVAVFLLDAGKFDTPEANALRDSVAAMEGRQRPASSVGTDRN